MLLMGDEVRRTQRGNNNAYCQDNEMSWFDWTLLEQHAGIHRFVKELTAFRQRRDIVHEADVLSLNELLRRAKIEWHGVRLEPAGLGRRLARPRLHAAERARAVSPPRDAERVLGAADFRAAAADAERRGALAALHRHRAALARGHPRPARRRRP